MIPSLASPALQLVETKLLQTLETGGRGTRSGSSLTHHSTVMPVPPARGQLLSTHTPASAVFISTLGPHDLPNMSETLQCHRKSYVHCKPPIGARNPRTRHNRNAKRNRNLVRLKKRSDNQNQTV